MKIDEMLQLARAISSLDPPAWYEEKAILLARAVIELLETPEPTEFHKAMIEFKRGAEGRIWIEPSYAVESYPWSPAEARSLAVALLRAADEADHASESGPE